jgi:hypothetical protein
MKKTSAATSSTSPITIEIASKSTPAMARAPNRASIFLTPFTSFVGPEEEEGEEEDEEEEEEEGAPKLST